MASPPHNPDSRELPYGWIQQYNWEYKQWFYVNTREQPPRSSWEHPLGPIPPPPCPPPGPPPDRSYNRPPYAAQPQQGYGGYPGYQPSYGQQHPHGYGNAPVAYGGQQRGYPQHQQVYVEEERKTRKGPGMGTALLAGGAGLVGGALLMDAFEDHNEHEREEGFEAGYDAGFDEGFDTGYDDGGGW